MMNIIGWLNSLPWYLDFPITLFLVVMVFALIRGGIILIVEVLVAVTSFLIGTIFSSIAIMLNYLVFNVKRVLSKVCGKSIDDSSKKVIIPHNYASKQFLTFNERKFFFALHKAYAESFHVMAQVRLADLIRPNGTRWEWVYLFNKIKSKHIDFVLISRDPK